MGLPSLLSDPSAKTPEEGPVHIFGEARRTTPSILYLPQLQVLVDHFIDGHARIKRSLAGGGGEAAGGKGKVIYEDVSMERDAFLVQQAMRVSNQINSNNYPFL